MPIILEPLDGWTPTASEVKIAMSYLARNTPGGLVMKQSEAGPDRNGTSLILGCHGVDEYGKLMMVALMQRVDGHYFWEMSTPDGQLSWEAYERMITPAPSEDDDHEEP